MPIKPIETFYNGYRFRSRLEARWAVFFDALEIKYEYEPEGYDLGKLGWYLPDFWLPQVKMFAEVKPTEFSPVELEKCRQLCKQSNYGVLRLAGTPAQKPYWGFLPGPCVAGDCPGKPEECERCPDRSYEPGEMDFFLHESHRYWLTEGRFFISMGCNHPEACKGCVLRFCENEIGARAVSAARQARFEHGESGWR